MTDVTGRLTAALSDRYRIERELGAGGMATVYLAEDLRHERKVAIKVLRPELSAIIGAERFVREIKTIAALQHPHILGLIDSGEVDGTAYYVMPYVEGESLRDRLNREKQLPVADALRIATEVASALDYAHRHGVIHRDIKPENVLLHDGQALVADFGIALAVSTAGGGTRMTETGMSLGTPMYMSPEQAMGEREITARSDVYALGAMTYEMLVGDPPFTGSTAQAIVAKVVTESPRPMAPQRHTVPPHVDAAVLTALEKLPADRFGSAAEFADALNRPDFVGRGGPAGVAAERAGSGTRLWQLATAAAVVGLGGLAAWGWLSARRAERRPTTWQYVALGDSVEMSLAAPSLALSPDGSTLVFKADDPTGRLWRKERGQLDPTPIAGTDHANDPIFSPDGQWIAFVADGRLKKLPLAGGAPITLADTVAGGFGGAAWMDDGTIIYVTAGLNELRRISATGGASTLALHDTTLVAGGIGSPIPLPGSRGLLFQYCSSGCATAGIHVLDLRTGKQRLLLNDIVEAWYLTNGQLLYIRRDGAGLVAPFSLKTLQLTGEGVPVLSDVTSWLNGGFSALTWSPTGTLVYVRGAAGEDLTVVRVDRTGAFTAIDSGWVTGSNSIAISPDGKRLAVGTAAVGGLDIWVKQLDHGPYTRLTFGNSDRRPAWSPDGREIAFIRDSANTSDVYEHPVDGSGPDRFLARLDRQVQEVTWSPDGAWLLLRTDNGVAGAGDIVGVRPSGDTTPVTLVGSPFTEIGPAVSPDGRWLAYDSDESGIPEVYVRPFPNTNGGRWQVSNGGGEEALWSPDGRELYYLSNGRFMAAQVAPGSSFSVLGTTPLFELGIFTNQGYHQSYAVAPDGQHFYFQIPRRAVTAGTKISGLVWVDNWFQELKERAKR